MSKKAFVYVQNQSNIGELKKERLKGSIGIDVLEVIPRGREQIVFNFEGEIKKYVTDNFTQQHRFWKTSGRLDDWNHELLHLKSPTFAPLFYLYKRGYDEIFIDGGLFSLIEGQFERKIVYQLLEQLRTFGACSVHVLQGKYGSSFTCPTYVNLVDNQKVFIDLSVDQYEKFEYLMGGKNKFPVFLNEVNYDFENLTSTSIVGNSSSLLENNFRERIESNRCIVRINDAPCDGFENSVGKKTDFRFVNSLLTKETKVNKKEFNLKELNKLCGNRLIFDVQEDSEIIEIAKKVANKNELYFLSEEFSKEIKNIADIYNLKTLSSGLKVTLLFGALSDRVEVFGMDFYNSSKPHYWENIKKEDIDKTHNWDKEEDVFNYLEDNFNVKRFDSHEK